MSTDRKTLVILTPGFPENEEDSTCLPLQQQLVKTLKENYPDLDIRILSFQYPYHKKEYSWLGLPVIPFSGRNKGGVSKLLLRKKIITALTAIHQKNGIIGLLSFWYGECAFVGKRFGDKKGISHRCWILGQDAKKENKYPERTGLKPGELIALSDFVQDEFEKNHGLRPQHLVPPGLAVEMFSSAPSVKDIDVIAVGSLIGLKQFDVFIRIVAQIKTQYPGLKAVLVGDGPEKDRLKTLIKELGLESTLVLKGEIPHEEVIQLMKKAKTLLHTSSYEGFGMVCIEAIAAGAHTISFVKPMKEEIERWHVVTTSGEMSRATLDILKSPGPVKESLPGFDITKTAKKIMHLFLD